MTKEQRDTQTWLLILGIAICLALSACSKRIHPPATPPVIVQTPCKDTVLYIAADTIYADDVPCLDLPPDTVIRYRTQTLSLDIRPSATPGRLSIQAAKPLQNLTTQIVDIEAVEQHLMQCHTARLKADSTARSYYMAYSKAIEQRDAARKGRNLLATIGAIVGLSILGFGVANFIKG